MSNKIPDRIRYYLLDFKDKHLKEFRERYGHGSIKNLTPYQVKDLWEWAIEHDQVEVEYAVPCFAAPGSDKPCSTEDPNVTLERIYRAGSIGKKAYNDIREGMTRGNTYTLKVNKSGKHYIGSVQGGNEKDGPGSIKFDFELPQTNMP